MATSITNEKDRSFMFLMSSVGKDYFTFKMKIEPLITNPKASIYTQDNFEFLCDLILKQHLYINELENKTKTLIEELSKLKQTLEEKEKKIKSLNENVVNVFIKSNHEQEQIIIKLQQEIETLKLNCKIKGNYNNTTNTLSNVGLSGLTTAREDNKSNVSKRESKEEKSITNVLFKNNNTNAQINSASQSQNQSMIIHNSYNNQQTKTKKGINVYLHKEKLKLINKTNSINNKKKGQNIKSCFSQQYLQTSLKYTSNASRNNSNNKNNSSFTVKNNSINNSIIDCKLIRKKINKMKLNLNNMFGTFSIGSKMNKMRKNSSIY
jgi:hypothetical protein